MLDMGWTEILVIGVVALIVVGPKDLPRMLRTLGQYTGKLRGMAREFQRSMDDAAREADLAEFKDINKSIQDVRAIGSDAAKAVQQGIRNTEREIEAAAEDKPTPEPEPKVPPAGVESTIGDLPDDKPAPKAAAPAPTPQPAAQKTGTDGA